MSGVISDRVTHNFTFNPRQTINCVASSAVKLALEDIRNTLDQLEKEMENNSQNKE